VSRDVCSSKCIPCKKFRHERIHEYLHFSHTIGHLLFCRVGISVWQYYESMSVDELYVNVKNTSRGDSTVTRNIDI